MRQALATIVGPPKSLNVVVAWQAMGFWSLAWGLYIASGEGHVCRSLLSLTSPHPSTSIVHMAICSRAVMPMLHPNRSPVKEGHTVLCRGRLLRRSLHPIRYEGRLEAQYAISLALRLEFVVYLLCAPLLQPHTRTEERQHETQKLLAHGTSPQ